MAILVEHRWRLASEPAEIIGCKLQVDIAHKENESEEKKEQEENDPTPCLFVWWPYRWLFHYVPRRSDCFLYGLPELFQALHQDRVFNVNQWRGADCIERGESFDAMDHPVVKRFG